MSDRPGNPHSPQGPGGRPASELLPLVYKELRKLARVWMAREHPSRTLTPTALVHEAFMRIVGSSDAGRFEGPGHFFSAAATAMRRVLIDQARRRRRIVRGGDRNRIELDPDLIPSVQEADEVLALDAALCKFAEIDPVKARLVELRYFAGLTLEEAGRILGISARTADRHWAYARAWLHREIRGETPERTNSADPS